MDVGGVGPVSEHEHTAEISEEQKCIKRRANNAEGDGSEGTLEGSSIVAYACEKWVLRDWRHLLTRS